MEGASKMNSRFDRGETLTSGISSAVLLNLFSHFIFLEELKSFIILWSFLKSSFAQKNKITEIVRVDVE